VPESHEQLSGIYFQAFEGFTTLSQDADEAESGSRGHDADDIPGSELGRDAPRESDMPGLVSMYAAEDGGHDRLLREDAIRLEQRGEDQANRRVERCDRGKVQADVGLRDGMVKAEHGAAQLPIWCRCR
jgi:hypothetical protein